MKTIIFLAVSYHKNKISSSFLLQSQVEFFPMDTANLKRFMDGAFFTIFSFCG